MTDSFDNTTVGEIVASDFRTAGVFDQFGIDFCCGGRRTVADACRDAAANPETVRQALDALQTPTKGGDHVTDWTVDQLVAHILSTHHSYVRTALPTISHYLRKLVAVHGARHPELVRIAAVFATVCAELQQHMMKEELVLFPYILELKDAGGGRPHASPFGTVQNPIRMMEREHQEAGDEMRRIRELTNNYTPPADACTTYRVAFAELARFERDLHVHVHLENNVLFPKAIALEQRGWRGQPR